MRNKDDFFVAIALISVLNQIYDTCKIILVFIGSLFKQWKNKIFNQ